MTYRRSLCLTAVGLLVVLQLWLGAVLYRHATQEAGGLISTVDRIHLSNTAFDLGSAMGDTLKACQYLKQSGRLLSYIEACLAEDTPMGWQAKAFENMREMLSIVMNGDDLIRSIIITTPTRRFHNSMDTLFLMNLELDSGATSEIRISVPKGVNYFEARNRTDRRMSDYPHFSFALDGNAQIAAFVVLNETFLQDLLDRAGDMVVADTGEWLYWPPETLVPGTPEAERVLDFARSQLDEAAFSGVRAYRAGIAQTGWSLVYLRDQQPYTQVYRYVLWLMLGSVAASVLLSLALSRVLFQSALQPLGELLAALRAYKEPGGGQVRMPERRPIRRAHSFREQLFLYLFITVFMPIALMTLLFGYGSAQVRRGHLLDAHTAIVQNMANTFERYLSRKAAALERIVYDSSIAAAVSSPELLDSADLLTQAVRENAYFNIEDSKLDIYDRDGVLRYSNNMFASAQLALDNLAFNRWQLRQDQTGDLLLTLTAPIRANRFYITELGYARLTEAYRSIDYMMRMLSADAHSLSFTDEQGRSLLGTKRFAIDRDRPMTREGLYVTPVASGVCIAKPIGRSPFFIAAEYEAPNFLAELITLLWQHTLIYVVILLLLLIAAYFLSRVLLRPLGELARMMAAVEPGNPALRAGGFYIDEIHEISRSFNDMADRVDSLVEDLVLSNNAKLRLENERKHAEIVALQMQINPHFLSNTVESISNTILEGGTDLARSMLFAMNNLFRYGISRPDYIIPIAEELTYARSYVAIMSFRYPSIRFTWEIDEALTGFRTVKLILQPLIENAIYHGINRVDYRGEIRILCRAVAEFICLEVRDNGVGMEPERLAKLREELRDARLGHVIGLFNVQARIRLQYGEAYGLELQSEPGQGSTVRIKLPRSE